MPDPTRPPAADAARPLCWRFIWPGETYLTGKSPRALWQRFLIWRAHNRPVTFRDLRRIAHDVCYRDRDWHKPCPVGMALFERVVMEAERPVFDRGERPVIHHAQVNPARPAHALEDAELKGIET